MKDMEWAGSTCHGFMHSNCVIFGSDLDAQCFKSNSNEANTKMGHGLTHLGCHNLLVQQNITLWIHMKDMEWACSTCQGFMPSNCVIFGSDLVWSVLKNLLT
jgi:hypothetical protein